MFGVSILTSIPESVDVLPALDVPFVTDMFAPYCEFSAISLLVILPDASASTNMLKSFAVWVDAL